jgi:hypothetical protein
MSEDSQKQRVESDCWYNLIFLAAVSTRHLLVSLVGNSRDINFQITKMVGRKNL